MTPEKRCPICGKPVADKFKPFCSGRCADVDLNRWLTGSYVIAARDEEPPAADPDRAFIPGDDEDDNI